MNIRRIFSPHFRLSLLGFCVGTVCISHAAVAAAPEAGESDAPAEAAVIDETTKEWNQFECLPNGAAVDPKILTAVEQQYDRIHDLAADFSQLSYFLGTDRSQQSDGKVYFLRPGKMDWVYAAPDEQRFVSDGASVWWYQPAQSQVTVRKLDQSFVSDVPVSFLLGVGKLHESFRLEKACQAVAGNVLTLLPQKPNASLDRFLLLVDAKDNSPKGARILDVGGNETSIVFGAISWNKGVEEKRFHFEIPKGTDIIDERNASKKSTSIGVTPKEP